MPDKISTTKQSLIIQGILAILAGAPQITELAVKAKEFFSAMFTAGLITKEQQDSLHLRVDADLALFKSGVPLHWTVQPDPGVLEPQPGQPPIGPVV